jgi:hypothetical protein
VIFAEKCSAAQVKSTLPGRAPMCMVNDVLYYTCRDGINIEACGAASRKYEKIALLKVYILTTFEIV